MAGKGIPFLDLIDPHVELLDELMEAVKGVLISGTFVGGPVLQQFERDFAQFCDVEHCVGVSSGTDALRFALIAAGVRAGDIVVTVPNTFVATVEAIIQAGAVPHFVDADPQTHNMSVRALGEYLQTQCEKSAHSGLPMHRHTGRPVKAVIPVHLYGQMCDMDPIVELSDEYGLTVFEDACQAHGAEYFSTKTGRWQKAGSVGRAAAFSFYPGKNLGACGEAGAITTNDAELAGRMRMIRDHGQNKKYHHLVEGYNGRLDAMQAAILQVKLPHLNAWNARRRELVDNYNRLLAMVNSVAAPKEGNWSRGVYHLYVVRVTERDELQKRLTEKNIGTGLHYPVPVHMQQGYLHLGYRRGDLPVAERLAEEILSLPMYPQMQSEQQQRVVNEIREFYSVPLMAEKILQQ